MITSAVLQTDSRMRIGILTYFRPINYGAYLQAYALSHRLNQEEGIEAEIIDFHMPQEDEVYEKQLALQKIIPKMFFERARFKTFREALSQQLLSDSACSGEIKEFTDFVDGKYDVIIAGSDEIWKIDGCRGYPTPYFLPGELGCKKVSYAASGRSPFCKLNKEDQESLKEYFDDFSYIGVRDEKTRDEILTLGISADRIHMDFDPSFVYDFKPDRERGKELLKKYYKIYGKKKIIAVLVKEGLREKPGLGRYLMEKYGKEFDFIAIYEWNAYLKNYPKISPFEWKDMLAGTDGVISAYFHGICFSYIAGTPFYALEKRAKNNEESKLYDLLRRFGMLNRYSFKVQELISNSRFDDFLNDVREGRRMNSEIIVNQARTEFGWFIDGIRKFE